MPSEWRVHAATAATGDAEDRSRRIGAPCRPQIPLGASACPELPAPALPPRSRSPLHRRFAQSADDDKSARVSLTGYYAVQHEPRYGRPLQLGRAASRTRPLAPVHAQSCPRSSTYATSTSRGTGTSRSRSAIRPPWKNVNAPSIGLNLDVRVRAGSRAVVDAARRMGLRIRREHAVIRSRAAPSPPSRRSTRRVSCSASASPHSAASTRRRYCRSRSSTGRSTTSGASTNPFEAGPAGGAGLEARVRARRPLGNRRGRTYRSYRFRLATDNRRRRASARTASSRSSCASRASSRRTRGSISRRRSRPTASFRSTPRMAAAATATTTTSARRSAATFVLQF